MPFSVDVQLISYVLCYLSPKFHHSKLGSQTCRFCAQDIILVLGQAPTSGQAVTFV